MKLRVGKPKQTQRESGRQRRNTLGREAPSAFSYHAQRAKRPDAPGRQQTNAVHQRHHLLSLQFWVRRSGLLIVAVAGLVCVISLLDVSSQPRIVLLHGTSSAAFHNTTQYQQAAANYLRSSIWNKNKITVNTGAASKDLQRQFPELANVTITLPLVGHRPIYYLHANAPAFVLQAVNGTYVLDSGGTALIARDAAPDKTVASLPVIADQTGSQVRLGMPIISGAEARFIQTVIVSLTAKGITVSSLVLPPGAVQELDVRIEGQPYIIKFNMHDVTTARQQAGTYLATANNLAGQQISPSQYIDVRVLGRAYYQ